jgi:hypothetical protein
MITPKVIPEKCGCCGGSGYITIFTKNDSTNANIGDYTEKLQSCPECKKEQTA